jgi:putative transposase of IS4/5 family DUF4096
MRHEPSDFEWTAIKPMLPNKPRGVRRVNDRRVLNGIFWLLRSGAPWRDLPKNYGPYTTCYNRFVRWRRASATRIPGISGSWLMPATVYPSFRRNPIESEPPAVRPGRTERISGSALSASHIMLPAEASTRDLSLVSVKRPLIAFC